MCLPNLNITHTKQFIVWFNYIPTIEYIGVCMHAMKTIFTCHRMHSFESYNLWNVHVHLLQQFFQVFGIVVSVHVFGNSGVTDSHDHGSVVTFVGEYLTSWK